MSPFRSLFGSSKPAGPYQAPAGIPAPGGEHELVLYKYDACPYCWRVMKAMEQLGVTGVEMKDTRKHPEDRQALVSLTGRTQVPCLVIDGTPLLESEDIVDWLQAHAAA